MIFPERSLERVSTPQERDEEQARRERSIYFAGLDLGEVHDFTALAVIRADFGAIMDEPKIAVVYLTRYRNVLYPDVARDIHSRMLRPPLWGQADLVVDATGVGRGVTDIYTKLDIPFTGVVIHGGEREHKEDDGYWRVPKKSLVMASVLPFQQNRMSIARGLELSPTLKKELQGFRLKQNQKTGHESFSHREGEHDDLVLAVSLACWGAMRLPGGEVDETLSGVIDPYAKESVYGQLVPRSVGAVETTSIDELWGDW